MLKNIVTIFFSFALLTCQAHAAVSNVDEVKHDMNAMTALWNKGDIKSFVQYYKNADDTTYVSASVYKGYKDISSRYLSAYPTTANMGTLTTSHLDIRALSPTIATVVGEWSLAKKDTAPQHGIFTLVWEKTTDGWKIILDHTS